ncbi:MAG: VCBS repeat-containing protein [Planctomycetes bacterium]|nr:VCBS repeat-containing protein [Planctomycetota bacterium]
MSKRTLGTTLAALTLLAALPVITWAGQVQSTTPAGGAGHIAPDQKIVGRFNTDMQATPGGFVARGSYGALPGSLAASGKEVSFTPGRPLFPGETVELDITNALLDVNGATLSNPRVLKYTTRAGRGPADFQNPVNIVKRGFYSEIDCLADMNGDGWLDLVCPTDTSIAIHYNNAGLIETAFTELPAASGHCNDLAAVDIDNDGDLDLIRLSIGGAQPAYTAYYLFDSTTGAWANPVTFGAYSAGYTYTASIGYPQSISMGDVNGDGFADAFVCANGTSMLYLNSSGSFPGSGTVVGFTGIGLSSDFGDVDNDGDLDLIQGTSDRAFLFLNDGSGNFSWKTSNGIVGDSGIRVEDLEFADMDGDGWLDVVLAPHHLNGQTPVPPSVYFNDGAGGFAAHVALGTRTERCYTLDVADLNGDGCLDVVIADEGGSASYSACLCYLNDGTGLNYQTTPIGWGYLSPWEATVGDIDNDGDIDILGTPFGKLTLYRNGECAPRLLGTNATGASISASFDQTMDAPDAASLVVRGSMTGAPTGTYSGGGTTVSFTPAQAFQPNETVEVSLTPATNASGIAINGSHVWRFTSAAAQGPLEFDHLSIPFGQGSGASTCLATGDLDGDGHVDIVEGISGGLDRIYLNGGYSFPSRDAHGTAADTQALALADIDGDGDLDLVSAVNGQNQVYLWGGTDFSGGNVSFGGSSENSTSVAVADMNGDGLPDIVVGNSGARNAIHLNQGGSGIGAAAGFGEPSDDTRAVAVGDFDGDGDLDVMTGDYQGNVTLWLNAGDATLIQSRVVVAGPLNVAALAAADMNNDGACDLVVGLNGGQDCILLNDGTGRFGESIVCGPATGATSSVSTGDVDGDGDLDLLIGYTQGGHELWLNGSGSFTQCGANTSGTDVRATGLFDADGDGDLDEFIIKHNAPSEIRYDIILPTVSLAAATSYVTEGAGVATISVTLSSVPTIDVAIDWAAVAGTALSPADFNAASGSLIIPAGTIGSSFDITINDDLLDENDETVLINLTSQTFALPGSVQGATLYILDDDGQPNVRLASAQYEVLESLGVVNLTIELSNPSGLDVSFDYTTSDGTAYAGYDYTATTGSAIIPAGQVSTTISVPILGDDFSETDEVFQFSITGAVNAGVSALNTAGVTIHDDARVRTGDGKGATSGCASADGTSALWLLLVTLASIVAGLRKYATTRNKA